MVTNTLDYRNLMEKLVTLQREVNRLSAMQTAGQSTYTDTITGLNTTHTHSRASIVDLDDDADIDHDALTNFVANEHIDWTSTSENFSTSGTLASGAATITGNVTLTGGVISGTKEHYGTAHFISFDDTRTGANSGTQSMKMTGNRWNDPNNHLFGIQLVNSPEGNWSGVRVFDEANFGDASPDNLWWWNSPNFEIKKQTKFDAVDVNFANGTTYKVESDGDAYFKEGHFSSHIYLGDNDVLHGGGGNDFRFYHTGTNSFIDNAVGHIFITNNAAAKNIYFDSKQYFDWRDVDDSSAVLLRLDSDNRKFEIGTATDGITIWTDGTQGVASFGPAAPASITVKNGLVTAISS